MIVHLDYPETLMPGAQPKDVVDWLGKQGYPLEMRVARELRHRRFAANVGTYYRDPETSDLREIDVVGSRSEGAADDLLNVDIIVSCKVSLDAPWVALHSDLKPLRVTPRILRLTAGNAGRLLGAAGRDSRFAENELIRGSPAAHGMVPMRGSKARKPRDTDAAYEALMSASKAAIDSIRRDREIAEGDEGWHSIVLPVIVVDGQLFDVRLDEAGSPVALDVSQTRILLRRPIGDQRAMLVDVVTAVHWKTYLNAIVSGQAQLVSEADRADSQLYKALTAPRSIQPRELTGGDSR